MANLDEAVSVVLAYLRLAACQCRSSPSTAAESMRSPLRTSPPLFPHPLTPSLSLPYTSISLLQSQLNCRRVTSVKPPLTFVLSPLFHLSLFSTSSSARARRRKDRPRNSSKVRFSPVLIVFFLNFLHNSS